MITRGLLGSVCYIGDNQEIKGTIEEIIFVRGMQLDPVYLVAYWHEGQVIRDRFHTADIDFEIVTNLVTDILF